MIGTADEAVDIRFHALGPAVVRVSGLATNDLLALARDWAADVAPAGADSGPHLAQLDVSIAESPPTSQDQHRATVSLAQGSIVIHPDRPAVTAHGSRIQTGNGLPRDLFSTGMILALARLGIAFLHGTAFQIGDAAPIAVGTSGAGKSTLAAAALGCGAQIVSDDSLLARFDDAEVSVSTFRSYLSFREDPAGLLPVSLRDRMELFDDDGRTCWRMELGNLEPSAHTPLMIPDRIWVLSVDRRLRRSRITPLDQAEGLAALIPASLPLMLSPRYRRERAATMAILTRLAEGCPSYRIRLGHDLLNDPAGALAALLEG